MDQTAYHGPEADEADEPAYDEQYDDDVDEIVHGGPFFTFHVHMRAESLFSFNAGESDR